MNELVSDNDSETKKPFDEADKVQKDLRKILVDLEKDIDKHFQVTVPSLTEEVLDTIKDKLFKNRANEREEAVETRKRNLQGRLSRALTLCLATQLSTLKTRDTNKETRLKHLDDCLYYFYAIKRLGLRLGMDMDVEYPSMERS